MVLLGVGFVVWRLFLRKGDSNGAPSGKVPGGHGSRRSPLLFFRKGERGSAEKVGMPAGSGVLGTGGGVGVGALSDDESDVNMFRANIDQYHAPRATAASNF